MLRFVCLATVLLLSPVLLLAQQPITLDVVVTPTSGHDREPVAGLRPSDFIVLDNGQAQPITSFRPGPTAESLTEVVLIVDAVNTRYSTVSSARQQMTKFLRDNSGHLALPTTLAIFTDAGLQLETSAGKNVPVRDGNLLAAALDHQVIGLRSIRQSEGIYGAEERFNLSMSALRGLALHEAARPGRKLVLWVSPGWPALSGPGIQLSNKQQEHIFSSVVELSGLLRQANITLYAISPIGAGESVLRSNYYEAFLKGVDKPSQTDIGDLSLEVLATQTGGIVFSGGNDIAAYLRQSVDDASAFYRLTFIAPPPDHPRQYHAVELKVERPGLTARTRTGYYSPAPPAPAPPPQ